jgi:4-amino-4-deoxy-L-arabinose transferase-like glycosyltransferase
MSPKTRSTSSPVFYLASFLYLLTRLINLTALPVFVDEAIYIRWAQLIKNVPSLFFIPLTDGKQPLFMWLTALLLRFFSDPLLAGRLVSVLAGLLTLYSIYKILDLIFPKAKNIALFIYLICPLTFFFDRMALADNLLSALAALSFLFTLRLYQKPSLKSSLSLGFCLGLAWLTKSPALYFIFLSIGSFVFLSFPAFLKTKKIPFRLIFWVAFSSVLTFFLYNLLRLSPSFHMIGLRNQDYIWSFADLLAHPLDPLKPHLSDIITWYRSYALWPAIYVSLAGYLLFLFKKTTSRFDQRILLVFFWYLLPLLATSILAKVFTARYILFTVPFLIILLSIGLSLALSQLRFAHFLLFLLFIPAYRLIYSFSFTPFLAKLPATESGYLQDWTAGWGIKETADYLNLLVKEKPIVIGTEGNFGTLPDGLQIYTDGQKDITVIGLGFGYQTIPEPLLDSRAHGNETFILANQNRLGLSSEQYDLLELVQEYKKPGNTPSLLLYRLK